MLFFKRILESRKPAAPTDRRGAARFPINHRFPIKAVLNTVGRDELGHPLKSSDGRGWDWTGRLLNLSTGGARMQVPSTVHVHKGDTCLLKFDLEGYPLELPAEIAHISERRDSFVYGLRLQAVDPTTGEAYRQLLDLVALGATLRQVRPCQPDESGYLVEQYAGDEGCVLTIWRDLVGRTVAGFDFLLKGCRIRGTAGHEQLQYLLGEDLNSAQPAQPAQAAEIHRLFHWVVPNINVEVQADVREFLEKFAA